MRELFVTMANFVKIGRISHTAVMLDDLCCWIAKLSVGRNLNFITGHIFIFKITMQRARYCEIKFCPNSFGSKDTNIQFFTIPRDETLRQKWIESIKTVQKYSIITFKVCERHFHETAFTANRKLKKNSIPSIFNER